MSAVSFRIARPDGSGRHAPSNGYGHRNGHNGYASRSDDSEDSEGGAFSRSIGKRKRDEAITSIDKSGIRLNGRKEQKPAPLTITAIPNKDFRQAALDLRARKAGKAVYMPTATAMPGADSDSHASRPRRLLSDAERAFLASSSNVQRIGESAVIGGITTRQMPAVEAPQSRILSSEPSNDVVGTNEPASVANVTALDADALALRELLSSTAETTAEAKVVVIPHLSVTEEDAFRLDLDTRPDSTTLEEYESVPIEDFGAALLRGMSAAMTTEGRRSRPEVKPYVPKARTAMLGLGAKSREETLGDLGGAQFGKAAQKESKRDSMRFVPLQKVSKVPRMLTESAAALPAISHIDFPHRYGGGRSPEVSEQRRAENSHRGHDVNYTSRQQNREAKDDRKQRRDQEFDRRRNRDVEETTRDTNDRRERRRDGDDSRRHGRERSRERSSYDRNRKSDRDDDDYRRKRSRSR